MNTCLNTVYLKLHKIDSRIIRLALLALVLASSGGMLNSLPIAGDVGI